MLLPFSDTLSLLAAIVDSDFGCFMHGRSIRSAILSILVVHLVGRQIATGLLKGKEIFSYDAC